MLRWSLAFFVLGIIAAVFGFTSIATAFSEIARIFFVVFLVLFAISLFAGLFSRHAPAMAAGARTLAMIGVAALVGMAIYAWVDHDMSAERVGRAIDNGLVNAADSTAQSFADLASRASDVTAEAVDSVREDASDAADEVGETIAPEEE